MVPSSNSAHSLQDSTLLSLQEGLDVLFKHMPRIRASLMASSCSSLELSTKFGVDRGGEISINTQCSTAYCVCVAL